MKFIWIIFFLMISSLFLFAQEEAKEKNGKAYFGLGAGLDYGGLGFKGEFIPVKWLGLFAGVGYNFVEPGFNVGISIKTSDKKVAPVITGMYGYNAAIRIKGRGPFGGGSDRHRKSYYGVSAGAGLDIQTDNKGNKISLAVLVPFRNASFRRDYDELENLIDRKLWPVTFSFGVNFFIKNKSKK